jgi:hypothetical protein
MASDLALARPSPTFSTTGLGDQVVVWLAA